MTEQDWKDFQSYAAGQGCNNESWGSHGYLGSYISVKDWKMGNDGDGGNRRAKKYFFWEMMETVETEGQKKFFVKSDS